MNPAGLVPFGRALEAFHEGDRDARLDLRWDPGEEDSLPVSTFFEPPGASIVEVGAIEAARDGCWTSVVARAGSGWRSWPEDTRWWGWTSCRRPWR